MQGSLDIGRVLSRGFQTIVNQFPIFAALAIIFAGVPTVLLRLVMPAGASSDPAQALAFIFGPWFWGSIIISMLLSALLQAALVRASILDLRSQPVELGLVLLESLSLLLPMIGLSILMVLGIALGMILLIVPGVILAIMWIVSVPVLVEERRGIVGSMARSAELTKGSRWWIFLLIIIYLVASGMLSSVTGLALGASATAGATIPALLISLLISTLSGMVVAAMLAALYIELRMLKEGGTDDSLAAIFA